MPNQIVPYPGEVSVDQTTVFDLFVSGDYEIRLFGDPVTIEGQPTPVQRLGIQLGFLSTSDPLPVILEQHLDVIPDFVDGRIFSATKAFGIGLKSTSGWWCTDTVVSPTNQVCLVQVPQTRTEPFLGLGGFPFQFRPISPRTPSVPISSSYLYAERSTPFREFPQFHIGSQRNQPSNWNKWKIA